MALKSTFVLAITGASGSLYGLRLLRALLSLPTDVLLVLSDAGRAVMVHETECHLPIRGVVAPSELATLGIETHTEASLQVFAPRDLFAPPASGSFRHQGMVIAPCSMKTLGAIASGYGDNLIQRAADVCLKEKRPLVLLLRETPLNVIHLENMHRAARAGAIIMPASPGFYLKPATITELVDGMVGRVLDQLGVDHDVSERWGEPA